MSKEDFVLFSHEIDITNLDNDGFTEKERLMLSWLAYLKSIILLLIIVLIISVVISIFSTAPLLPLLLLPCITVLFFNFALVLAGRIGIIFCVEELDGNNLHIESGINWPRDYFRRSKTN